MDFIQRIKILFKFKKIIYLQKLVFIFKKKIYIKIHYYKLIIFLIKIIFSTLNINIKKKKHLI